MLVKRIQLDLSHEPPACVARLPCVFSKSHPPARPELYYKVSALLVVPATPVIASCVCRPPALTPPHPAPRALNPSAAFPEPE